MWLSTGPKLQHLEAVASTPGNKVVQHDMFLSALLYWIHWRWSTAVSTCWQCWTQPGRRSSAPWGSSTWGQGTVSSSSSPWRTRPVSSTLTDFISSSCESKTGGRLSLFCTLLSPVPESNRMFFGLGLPRSGLPLQVIIVTWAGLEWLTVISLMRRINNWFPQL